MIETFYLGEVGAWGRSYRTSHCSILPDQERGGLVGYHRGLEDQLPVVDQASHASAESKVQVGLCCTKAWKVQLLALLHVRLLHGLRPGVQVQLGEWRGW